MKETVCLVSLGCPKNLVDSEVILGLLSKRDIFSPRILRKPISSSSTPAPLSRMRQRKRSRPFFTSPIIRRKAIAVFSSSPDAFPSAMERFSKKNYPRWTSSLGLEIFKNFLRSFRRNRRPRASSPDPPFSMMKRPLESSRLLLSSPILRSRRAAPMPAPSARCR